MPTTLESANLDKSDARIRPMFAAIATADFLFRGEFGVIKAWFDAGRPVEFHLYQNGGHGFGLGNPNRTSNRWFDFFSTPTNGIWRGS